MKAFIAGVAAVVGLALALLNGDTWQRVLVTTLAYGAAAALLFTLVTLRADRPRTAARENISASRHDLERVPDS